VAIQCKYFRFVRYDAIDSVDNASIIKVEAGHMGGFNIVIGLFAAEAKGCRQQNCGVFVQC
jgi:hypothetical protein